MNTQLLARLRLAGFPQEEADAIPDCRKLIEACGEKLQAVTWERPANEWSAHSHHGTFYSGQTPEDALASFWLATNRQLDREVLRSNRHRRHGGAGT
jgi:hypothetical protein